MACGQEPRLHLDAVLLAAILYIFGDKSLVLAKLAMKAFHGATDGKAPGPKYLYEISLYGLMIGTCLVLIISIWRKHTLKLDNLTILSGVVVSTVAALFNIVEALAEPASKGLDDIPKQGLFFLVLWVLLIIVPGFLRVFRNGEDDRIDLTLLGRIVCALTVGVVLGALFRPGAVLVLREVLGLDSIDKLRFRPDTLIQLGAVWVIATFATFQAGTGRAWQLAYLALAPVAGFFYSYLISKPDGDVSQGISAVEMAIGYAALSAAAIVPSVVFAAGVVAGQIRPTLMAAGVTALACAVAMLAGLANTFALGLGDRIGLAIIQGLAGAMVPISAYLGVHAFALLGRVARD